MIVIGILVAYVSNFLIGGSGEHDWRWMLGVVAAPSLVFLALMFAVPESPRWLGLRPERREEALRVLRLTAGPDAEAVLADITREERQTGTRDFFSRRYARPILLAFLIAAFNQLSGINAIIYYAPRIIERTGALSDAALAATIGIGVVNLVFTLVGMALIDRAGRKTLMYVGSFGYIVSLFAVAWGFASGQLGLVPWFLFAFIAAHAVGQGAVIWVYISEIFPNAARGRGQALGAAPHWIFAAALTLVMPPVLDAFSPQAIFTAFGVFMAAQLLFVRLLMVETRGRTLEDISADLTGTAAKT